MSTRSDTSHSPDTRRWIVAVPLAIIGIALFACGLYLETRNPRTNAADNVAWLVLALGSGTAAAGFALPFLRLRHVAFVALAAPPVALTLAVMVFWSVMTLNALFHLGL